MAVTAYREVVPRTYEHKFGSSPTATLQYVATVDGPTTHNEVLSAIGIIHGSQHPEYTTLTCDSISLDETDRHHVTVSYSYSVPPGDGTQGGVVGGADKWAFSTGSGTEAATTYYDGDGNGNVLPLANAANDAYEGISKAVPELRATITGTRWKYPFRTASGVLHAINNALYAGCLKHTWQCVGFSGQSDYTLVGDPTAPEVKEYWNITVELVYRPGGFNLVLPHVGLNYLEGGAENKKKRCWIVDHETGEQVPSPNPLPLNGDGDLKQIGAGPYPPDLIAYRLYPEIDFARYFGNPPSSVEV